MRKIIQINHERCDLCGTCVGVCPENVMSMTVHLLSIDHANCTRCSKCVWACPVGALKLTDAEEAVGATVHS